MGCFNGKHHTANCCASRACAAASASRTSSVSASAGTHADNFSDSVIQSGADNDNYGRECSNSNRRRADAVW